MPVNAVESWPTGNLAPYEKNARTHSAAQVSAIANSIREFGFTNPVLISADGVIIAGHGRVEAAKSLGMETVPVIILDHLNEDQRRAYVLADNKLALNAGWNDEILAAELAALSLSGFDIELTGFAGREVDALLKLLDGGDDGADGGDSVAAGDPVTQPGDLWTLGAHRLLCGDSTVATDVERLLAGNKPHLMVTDPPYGVEYDATWRGKAGHATLGKNRTGIVENDDRADWRDVWALFPGSTAYVWHGGLKGGLVAEGLIACGFTLRSQIIWNKSVMAMGRGDYHWKHEPCWYAVRGTGNWAGDRKQTTVWDIASPLHIMGGSKEIKTAHPTQKPLECMRIPIENNSARGDAVYDPFCGSGTTLIAAEKTGRHCYAMELSPAYCDIIIQRWQSLTGGTAAREAAA